MKQYIGTKIIEAEPAYRCMDGQGHITITDDPSEAFSSFPAWRTATASGTRTGM